MVLKFSFKSPKGMGLSMCQALLPALRGREEDMDMLLSVSPLSVLSCPEKQDFLLPMNPWGGTRPVPLKMSGER